MEFFREGLVSPMSAAGCDYVSRYLDRFLDGGTRSGVDLEQVSDHVGTCPRCYVRLSHFFRTIELPESSYLRETIDELALSIYNLAKSVIRDRPPAGPDDATDNLRITVPGGGTETENVQAGVEMIDDAEDYAGSHRVAGVDLEALRSRLEDASTSRGMRIDLALGLFGCLTGLQSRYLAKAWNWIGALHLQKKDFDAAEAAFLKVLAAEGGDREVRSFAHCNLAYVFKQKGDLDRAIRSAQRSVVFAGEDGGDPYFGRFAEIYFRLLRGQEGDAAAARALLAQIQASPGGRAQWVGDLRLPSNEPVLSAIRNSPLAMDFPELRDPRRPA